MAHGPIQQDYREVMNDLAKMIDRILNEDMSKRTTGFALLMYPFGEAPKGRINYIGNGERADVLVALKELVARWEGQVPTTEEKH
jgi:hypothetical protein